MTKKRTFSKALCQEFWIHHSRCLLIMPDSVIHPLEPVAMLIAYRVICMTIPSRVIPFGVRDQSGKDLQLALTGRGVLWTKGIGPHWGHHNRRRGGATKHQSDQGSFGE